MHLQAATSTAIRLYKFNPKKKGSESWELYAATVTPSFYDVNEDSASGNSQWFLEAGELEVEVSDKFSFEESSRRATFAGETGIWALKFPSQQAFMAFVNQYNSKLFENTYKLSMDDSNREKVCFQMRWDSSHDMSCIFVITIPVYGIDMHRRCSPDALLCCRSLARTQCSTWAAGRQMSPESSGWRILI